jgi:thioredoxin-dependent peroxiredoxin
MNFLYAFLIGSLMMCCSQSLTARSLKAGDAAPDFSLPDENGKVRTLQEFRGKKVVLYFYPKDETPDCTKEACSIRDGFKELESQGIIVLGVSFDSVKSHKKFKEHHKLPFILLSDSNKSVAKRYHAVGNFLFFFTAPIPSRMTFLIDEQGKIVHIMEKVDVKNHASQILKGFGLKK